MGFLSGATVNTLYLVLLILGLVYAVFLLVSGQIGGDADIDSDLDLGADAGDTHHGISPISPLTIATFISAFGATGLVATGLLSVSERGSIFWAAIGGVLVSALVYVGFTYIFIKPQGSSEVRVADIAGSIAEVITPIPVDGMGEIALVAQGGRVTYSARGQQGEAIQRGIPVRVVRIVGGIAYVEVDKQDVSS
ncbi:MAG: NfeD family protein [Anaerolineales bacterium]|nr:NfeD family protein [Anaerolineales bacterium]